MPIAEFNGIRYFIIDDDVSMPRFQWHLDSYGAPAAKPALTKEHYIALRYMRTFLVLTDQQLVRLIRERGTDINLLNFSIRTLLEELEDNKLVRYLHCRIYSQHFYKITRTGINKLNNKNTKENK